MPCLIIIFCIENFRIRLKETQFCRVYVYQKITKQENSPTNEKSSLKCRQYILDF